MWENRTFYVDNRTGNDKNSGLSPDAALRTLEAVNGIVFQPGDRILFRAGGTYRGMFAPQGSGSRYARIEASAYRLDGDETAAAPHIAGEGAYAAILLKDVSFWKVSALEVTNHASERGVRQGICICGAAEGITEGIEICGCEIHDVTGENRRARDAYCSMYWNGGVYVTMPGRSSDRNHLHDIVIHNNQIHDVLTSGIRVNQEEDFINDIHHTHVVVRNNRIERTGSDGIIVANCISPLIDGNICLEAGALGTLEDTNLIAGIWVCAARDALIQRNEVAYTRMFENDGSAFDTDWGTAGTTIFQYNYTHDNEGGFWLNCMGLNYNQECEKTILRYNVSVNDGRGIGIYDQGLPAEFYRNYFIFEKQAPQICCFDEGENYHFAQNIFRFKEEPCRGWQKASYEGNRYEGVGINPADTGEFEKIPQEIRKFYEQKWKEKEEA